MVFKTLQRAIRYCAMWAFIFAFILLTYLAELSLLRHSIIIIYLNNQNLSKKNPNINTEINIVK
jgi:hypothetical protein